MSSASNSSQIALMFEDAKRQNQIEFDKFVKVFGLGTESCKCSSCFSDNPENCYTKSGAALWCAIDVIQPCSEQLTRPENFQIGMVLYVGISGEKQYMGIVRELTPEMAVLEIVSIISLNNGYLIFEPFNGNPREGTIIEHIFGKSDIEIFPIPSFLVKR